jgi:hypothetical protein
MILGGSALRGSGAAHGTAVALYTALALLFVDHGVSLTHRILGTGTDPFIFIWYFAWWPFALAHHLALFRTDLVWQPAGISVPWTTAVPALALPLAPITRAAGPVVAYNIVTLAAPVIDAWAGFWLCRRLTRRFVPALIGGFLYGFSSYVMAQDLSAPNLAVAICPPLLVLVALSRLSGHTGRGTAVAAGTALLVLQFLISAEIAAIVVLFGGLALTLAALYRVADRAALRALAVDGSLACLCVTFALSPILWHMMLSRNEISLPKSWSVYFTADILNFVIPSRNNLWSELSRTTLPNFNGALHEQDAYIGLPWLAVIALFMCSQPSQRWLVVLFVVLAIASLGPVLWVGGRYSGAPLPWALFSHLPLLKDALPTRFALFVSLCAAVIAALWLAGSARRYKWGALVVLSLLPAPHLSEAVPASSFFAPGEVQAQLGANPRLLVLPFAINGAAVYWQQENEFGFRQSGGYLGFPPPQMLRFPAVQDLFRNTAPPGLTADIAAFAIATKTDFVIVGPGTSPPIAAAIRQLGWPQHDIDDVTVFTVPPHG